MGATCSSNKKSLDVITDSTFVTLVEDATLLEMGFGDELCRMYDFVQGDTDDNTASLMVTKKEIPLEKSASCRSSVVAPNPSKDPIERKMFLLKRVTSENPVYLLRWYHTLDVLKELSHPCLPRVLDIHEEDARSFSFVMEACEGGHLFERVSFYPENRAKKLIRQILEVVAYLHAHNIVHSDLRAEWFLFASSNPKNWHIQLTDFSMAQHLPGYEAQSSKRQRIYHDHEACLFAASPQVINGRPHSKKGGMFSVGVILYRLLSGELPFGDNVDDLLRNMNEGPKLKFSQPVWAEVNPHAKDLISKLLAVQPQTRLTAKQALKHYWLSSFLPSASIRKSITSVRSHRRPSAAYR